MMYDLIENQDFSRLWRFGLKDLKKNKGSFLNVIGIVSALVSGVIYLQGIDSLI